MRLNRYFGFLLLAVVLASALFTQISFDSIWTEQEFVKSFAEIDLEEYEKKNDFSHVVSDHVAKDMNWLVSRIQNDKRIKVASSYPDINTAKYAVTTVLSSNAPKIVDWLNNPNSPSKKSFRHKFDKEIGYGVARSNLEKTVKLYKAVVVLIKLKNNQYGILTSYPSF